MRRLLLRFVQPDAEGRAQLRSLARRLLIPAALSGTLAFAGCASHSVVPEFTADSSYAAVPAHRRSEAANHRSDSALMAPQRAPDCAFKGSDIDPVDANLWERLRLDYERHCFQHAEMIVRNRLRLLQTSGRCSIEPIRRRKRFAGAI
jgi:hypothetical protein